MRQQRKQRSGLIYALAGVLTIAGGATVAARASYHLNPLDDARKTVQAIYKRADDAAKKKNAGDAYAHLADNFEYIGKDDAAQTAQARRDASAQLWAMGENFEQKTEVKKFEPAPQESEYVAQVKTSYKLIARDPGDNKKITMEGVTEATDTWRASITGNDWKLVRTKVTSSKAKMNGKDVE